MRCAKSDQDMRISKSLPKTGRPLSHLVKEIWHSMFKEVKAELEISATDFCGDELTSRGLFACLVRSPAPPANSTENHINLRPPRSWDEEELVEDPPCFRVAIHKFVFLCPVSCQAPLAVFSEAGRGMCGHTPPSPALGWPEDASRHVRLSNNGTREVFPAGRVGPQGCHRCLLG